MKPKPSRIILFAGISSFLVNPVVLNAQAENAEELVIQTGTLHQNVAGFGASLAYYEGWLNAHPNKAEIYEAIFGELSLDILRVRNAYDYDAEMVTRVQEYVEASRLVRGTPVSVLSTSWGPPGYLKNTGDRKNGGTLRYSIEGGKVVFDYAGFAQWWKESLAEYNAHGVFPDYITIQNEPNWSATWETCLLNPTERITASDTIAGYNKALAAVYDTLATLEKRPAILGPETVGIGYNNVESYVNNLDVSLLDGISHHLYHGVDENNPYASTDFAKVGNFHPELPHFQTEYDRGDWFSLAGLLYKSFYDEKVVAYLYWALIWNTGGLITLDNPWDRSSWTDPAKGYTKTKEFYAFKQFSAFIHPGWKMAGHSLTGNEGAALTFLSPTGDSATCVVINRSSTSDLSVHLGIPGYRIQGSSVYRTSGSENCALQGPLSDSLFTAPPRSITTVTMLLAAYDPAEDTVAPTIPEQLAITESTTHSITVAWAPSTDNIGVEGYRIYLNGGLNGATASTSYTITGLEPDSSYEISVSAIDHVPNESGRSAPVSGTTLTPDTQAPSVPVNLIVTGITQTGAEISWDPSTDDVAVAGYRVFINGVPSDSTIPDSYQITGLAPGTTYQVTVSAFDEAGNESAPSTAVTMTTLAAPDEDPPVLVASDSVYAEGSVEVVSTEDGTLYLVPGGTPAQLAAIRGAALDSLELFAGMAEHLSMLGLDNGIYLLFATDSAGNISQPEMVTLYGVGIEQFSLEPFSAFPNPFSQSTTLQFTLKTGQRMWLTIMDSGGRKVLSVPLGDLDPGAHKLSVSREGLEEGLHFFRLENSDGEGWSLGLIVLD